MDRVGKDAKRISMSFKSDFVGKFSPPYSSLLRGALYFVVLEKLNYLEQTDYFMIGEFLKKLDEAVKRGLFEDAKRYKEQLIEYLKGVGKSRSADNRNAVAELKESAKSGELEKSEQTVESKGAVEPEEIDDAKVVEALENTDFTVDM